MTRANADVPASGSRELYANLYVVLLCDEVWLSNRKLNRKFRDRNRHYRFRRIRLLRKPCVYVGQTSRDPEERFQQHKNGDMASRIARKYGVGLVPPPHGHHNPVLASEREEQEERLALDLQSRGYGVWWN